MSEAIHSIAVFLIGVIALYLLFGGFRFARSATALWGLTVGFLTGETLASTAQHGIFQGGGRSALLGLSMGILCALLAYLHYGFAVVILTAGIGFWIGSGYLLLLGFMPGVLSALVGLSVGVVSGVAILRIGLPRHTFIMLTSIAGSLALVGSVLVTVYKFSLESLSYVAIVTGALDSVIWLVVAIVIAIIGLSVQILTTSAAKYEKWIWGASTGNDRRRLHGRT